MSRPLNPLNKFYRTILVEDVNGTTGATTPIVSGTLTAFLATSNAPDATAVGGLTTTGTHIGVSVLDDTHPFPLGTWLVEFGGATLTVALLDSLFSASVPPYFIVSYPDVDRVYEKLTYQRSRKADLS